MATLMLSGCAAALLGRAASTGTSSGGSTPTSNGSAQRSDGASAGTAGTRTAAQVEQDRQIAATVRSRLLADAATKSLAVGVEAYQGVVSLHGEVAKAEQRSAAERVARTVAGVRQVRNELRVR
jgi:hyperosmotically inducible protein